MIVDFFNYKIKIKDTPFKTECGLKLDNTAAISFLDENKKEVSYIELGFIDANTIYKWIDEEKDICLDKCYIEDFSLTDYRSSRNLEKKSTVRLNKFSAYGAVFESKVITDFSFAVFDDTYKTFEGALFINGQTSFHNVNFGNGGINFSYCHFRNGNVDFSNIHFGNGEINFKNASFGRGHKDFKFAQFGEGQVLFTNTEFNDGDVSFVNAEFQKGNVSFKVARFGEGKIDFHFAKFYCKKVSFERVEFGNGKLDFRTIEFKDSKVNFNRAVYGDGEKSFEACQLRDGRMTFKKTIWGAGNINFELLEFYNSELQFDNADFGNGNISFNNSIIEILSLKSCHLNFYADLRVSNCTFIDMTDVVARDIIDIMPHNYKLDINTINFSGIRLIGRIYLDWNENNVKHLIDSQENTSKREKAEQYRILKENFNVTGQYSDEDKSYVEFKRYELKADLENAIRKNPISRIWQYPNYVFQWVIFDKVGLYATNPLRVLFSMVIGYLFFTLLYVVLPYFMNTRIVSSLGDPDQLSKIKVAFYHSAITFLTIGYGDYYPSGIIRGLSSLEGFVGLFLMSYFTVAFVRKILR